MICSKAKLAYELDFIWIILVNNDYPVDIVSIVQYNWGYLNWAITPYIWWSKLKDPSAVISSLSIWDMFSYPKGVFNQISKLVCPFISKTF